MLSRNARKKAAQILTFGFSPIEYIVRNADKDPDDIDDSDSIFNDNSDDFQLLTGRLTNFLRALATISAFPIVAAINTPIGAICGAGLGIARSIKLAISASESMGGSLISIIAGSLLVAAVISPFITLAYTLGGAIAGLALSVQSLKEWTGIPKSESFLRLLCFRTPATAPKVSSNTSTFWYSSRHTISKHETVTSEHAANVVNVRKALA